MSIKTRYRVSDGITAEIVTMETIQEVREYAEERWQDGSWDSKTMVDIQIETLGEDDAVLDREWISVECGEDPTPPDCVSDQDHDWCSPYEVVGGLKENPGVWSRGGTTIHTVEVCSHCGAYKRVTKYGSQRNPGQCDEVVYDAATRESTAWVDGSVDGDDAGEYADELSGEE